MVYTGVFLLCIKSSDGFKENMGNQQLTEVPSGLSPDITILGLQYNKISELGPDVFLGLIYVMELDLRNNRITYIDGLAFLSCVSLIYLSIYLRVYSLHHNVLPTLQSIPLLTNGPLYPITQDFSCHGQHTMPRNPWSFPPPVPHGCVCMNVCVLQWRKVCIVVL